MSSAGEEHGRLRALVVEDEWPARRYLVEILSASALVDVVASVATLDEARQAMSAEGVELDVAFIDINLATSGGEEAGMVLARHFAGRLGAPAIVLTTALKQHALEAFELGVVDYLLKPFDEERVGQCLERLRRALHPQRPQRRAPRIAARRARGLVFLRPEEVWAFESEARLTFVHTPQGRFDIDLSLAALESTLSHEVLRVHRSWLVTVEHVRGLERIDGEAVVLVGADLDASPPGIAVPIARDRLQVVRDLLLGGTTGLRKR
jgi:DNA-binding LytR/AlgR family response regulator